MKLNTIVFVWSINLESPRMFGHWAWTFVQGSYVKVGTCSLLHFRSISDGSFWAIFEPLFLSHFWRHLLSHFWGFFWAIFRLANFHPSQKTGYNGDFASRFGPKVAQKRVQNREKPERDRDLHARKMSIVDDRVLKMAPKWPKSCLK